MRFKFLDWYTQALGATFGILACIYAYLNGYMFVYGNIEGYFDFLGFSGVISSYLLLPLCLLSLFISLIRSYNIKKEILSVCDKLPYMDFIAWDLLITEEGLCVIEANASSGVNIIQLWGGQRHGELGDFFRHYGVIK